MEYVMPGILSKGPLKAPDGSDDYPFEPSEYPDLYTALVPFTTSLRMRARVLEQLKRLIRTQQADAVEYVARAFEPEGDSAVCCSDVVRAARAMANIVREAGE